MGLFTQNFNHGFFHGMFNGMFGGLNMFNNCCGWNSAPTFFTPSYSYGNFFQYPDFNIQPPSVWDMNIQINPIENINWSSGNFNYPAMPAMSMPTNFVMPSYNQSLNFGMPNFNYSNFTTPNYSNTFNWGDTFVNSAKLTSNSKVNNVDDYAPEATEDAKTMAKKWNKKLPNAKNITKQFCQKVIDISKEIKCKPEDLMAIMNLESAGTFDPKKQNAAGTNYFGLIQFGKAAAKDLGKTLDEIKSMTALEQLDYVKKYLLLQKRNNKITGNVDATTLYTLVFYPAWANKSNNEIIASRGSEIYTKNKGLDSNKDGYIKKSDFESKINEFRA